MKTPHHSALALTFFAAVATTSLTASANPPSAPAGVAQFSRDQLGTQLDQNLSAGKRALASARQHARALRGEARHRFEAAAADVDSAERRLRRSLEEAKTASVDEWADARARLASDYEAYSRAVVEVQRIVTAAAAGEGGRFSRHRGVHAEHSR